MAARVPELLLVLAAASACGRGGDQGANLVPPEPEAGARSPARSAPSGTPADAGVPDGAPLIVFLGDSITAGLTVERDEAFPSAVQRLLADEHPFRLVNAGVSGDTSAGGLRRLGWLLDQEPDVLVLELGGNDGLRGQAVHEIEARLRQIVERAEARGAKVLLLGVRLPPSLGADYVREFEELYPRLAEELGCAYLPFFMEGVAGVRGGMQPDGLHPTSAGHERIAAKVAPALAALLAGLAAR